MRRRWVSLFRCICVVLGTCTVVHAQTDGQLAQAFPVPVDLSTPQQPSSANVLSLLGPSSIAVLQDAPIDMTVEQIAVLPQSAFSEFNPDKTYPLNARKALWLHFRAIGPAATMAFNWTFELPKPFVDKVELYHRNPQGGWDKQQAGDWVPQAQWAIRGLHPQFHLPELVAGQNDFYVKVAQLLPLRFNVTLKAAESASFDHQNMLLADGLLLGLMLFVALFACVLALIYRNQIYGWYAAYVWFAFLAIASYVGLGYYALWPASNWLPEISHGVFLTLAIASQIQFCRVLFINPTDSPRLNLFILVWTLILTATAARFAFISFQDIEWRVRTVLVVVAIGTLLMLGVVLRAAFQRRPMALLWIVAYLPVIAVLALTLVEQFGLAALPWLPYNGIGLAVGFEVLLLLIGLNLHVKSNHAWDVRQTTLIELDPLSGFLAPLHFPETLAQLWSQARHSRQDIAVAYIRADIDLESKRAASPINDNELVLRCVRMLRMVTRPDDTVARIGGNVFAILMPRMSTGSNLAGKLSRLVALGVMRDTDDAAQRPVRFRIAATTFGSFSGTSKQLHEALKQKLGSLTAASERTIEFVRG